MEHIRTIKFLRLLKKSGPPKEEPVVPDAADTVFNIYELAENILSWLPALDLIVLQRISPACYSVVQTRAFQAKLFMTPDPLSYAQENKKFNANEISWNPFLMHYGAPSSSYVHQRMIKRAIIQTEKFDRPDASWRKMFLTHPTRLGFCAHVESGSLYGTHDCYYNSPDIDGNRVLTMEFLMRIDKKCSELGHRRKGDKIFLLAM